MMYAIHRILKICVPIALGILALISSLTFNSCRDQYPSAISAFDTIRDTIDLDDSNIWVIRNSGTNENFTVCQCINSMNGFIGGGMPPGVPGDGIILSTLDGGNLWQIASSNVGTSGTGGSTVYGMFFFDAKNGVAVGDGSNVWLTFDGGVTWSPASCGSMLFLRSLCFTDPKNGFLGTSDPANAGGDGEIWGTNDGGNSWNLVTTTSGGIYEIRFITPSDGVALGRFGIALWTSDGGATWNTGYSDQTGNTSNITRATFISNTIGFATCYIDQTHGAILKTNDAGRTWNTILSPPAGLSCIASNGNGVVTACGEFGTVVESTDGGTTWKTSNIGSQRWIADAYAGMDRTVLAGVNGRIATRNK